jgi:periplasmic protein TonB
VTLRAFIHKRAVRFSALLAGAVAISMGIFALVPVLLRQTTLPSHFPQTSHALLIPVRPEPPPDPMTPEPESPVEIPEPPEPELTAELPEIPEIDPPETKQPEPMMEVTQETVDTPLSDPPVLDAPVPEPPPLQMPPLHAVALSALPVQSSPMNLAVTLRVGKAAPPQAMARPAAPPKPAGTRTQFGMHEVDEKPMSLAALKPDYPFSAKRRGIEGYVTVQFLVDREGRTRDLKIVAAEPEGVFDQAVRSTVPRWRFKPGKKAGRAVETWVERTIRFELGRDG